MLIPFNSTANELTIQYYCELHGEHCHLIPEKLNLFISYFVFGFALFLLCP
jgi:hypothetical protein